MFAYIINYNFIEYDNNDTGWLTKCAHILLSNNYIFSQFLIFRIIMIFYFQMSTTIL